MTTIVATDLHVGDRVYYRGRHYEVRAVRETNRGPELQILPDGRKQVSPFDWIPLRSLIAAGAERSGT